MSLLILLLSLIVFHPILGQEEQVNPTTPKTEQSLNHSQTQSPASVQTSDTDNTQPTHSQNVDVLVSLNSQHPTLQFDWKGKKPALAIVQVSGTDDDFNPEGGQWWIVFDENAVLSLPDFKENPIPGIKSIETISSTEGVVLLIKTNPSLTPTAVQEQDLWQIEFKPQPIENVQHASLQLPQKKDDGLIVNLATSGKEIRFQDPYTGYTNIILPTQNVGFGVEREHVFPELRILKTYQGVAIELLKEDLSIQATPDKATMTHPDGFSISSLQDQSQSRQIPVLIGLFSEAQDLDWVERRRKINEALLDLPHDQHGSGELEIAWLLLCHGHAREALGYLTHLGKERPSIVHLPIFQMLRGMGNLLANQLPEAQSALYKLKEEPEVKLWLLLINTLQYPQYFSSNPKVLMQLRKKFQSSKDLVKQYPKPLRSQMVTLILMAGIATQDLETLSLYLDQEVRPENLSASNVYDLARSRVLMSQKKPDAALQILGELMEKGTSPIVRAIARFDYVTHRLESKVMDEKEGLPQLYSLRSQWHGGWFDHQVGAYLKTWETKKGFGQSSAP